MTSSHHALYGLGYTRTTMGRTKRSEVVRRSETEKTIHSSDCRLKPACMKSESLVIAGQHTAVNTFPGLAPPVTPRKSFTPEVPRGPKAGAVTGVKS